MVKNQEKGFKKHASLFSADIVIYSDCCYCCCFGRSFSDLGFFQGAALCGLLVLRVWLFWFGIFNISLFQISIFPHLAVKLGENSIWKYKNEWLLKSPAGKGAAFVRNLLCIGSSEAGGGGQPESQLDSANYSYNKMNQGTNPFCSEDGEKRRDMNLYLWKNKGA